MRGHLLLVRLFKSHLKRWFLLKLCCSNLLDLNGWHTWCLLIWGSCVICFFIKAWWICFSHLLIEFPLMICFKFLSRLHWVFPNLNSDITRVATTNARCSYGSCRCIFNFVLLLHEWFRLFFTVIHIFLPA